MKILFAMVGLFIYGSIVFSQGVNLQWAHLTGGNTGDWGTCVATDASGNVIIGGFFSSGCDFDPGPSVFNLPTGPNNNVYVQKLDSNANFLWAKSFNGIFIYFYSVNVDENGNILLTGTYKGTVDFDPGPGVFNLSSANNNQNIFVLKLDPNGNFLWAKAIGGSSDDQGFSVTTDLKNNVYVTGYYSGTVDFDPGVGVFNMTSLGNDIYVIKLDSSGIFQWAKSWGGNSQDGGVSIELHQDSSIVVSGYFVGTMDADPGLGVYNLIGNGDFEIFVMKIDLSGNFIWARSAGGTGVDVPRSVCSDSTGNVYVTGYFQNSVDFDPGPGQEIRTANGDRSVFIWSFNKNGNFRWVNSFGGNDKDEGYSVSAGKNGQVYIAGQFTDTVDFDPDTATFCLASIGFAGAFLEALDTNGNFLWAEAFPGTPPWETSHCVTTDLRGDIYVTGHIGGTNEYDPGPSSLNLTSIGISDMFLQKLRPCNAQIFVSGNQTACQGDTLTLTASGANSYYWNNGSGSGTSFITIPQASAIVNVIGTTNGCHALAQVKISVFPAPVVAASSNQNICEGDTVLISASGASSYSWDNGVGAGSSVSVSPDSTTVYTVTGTTNGCKASDQVLVTVIPLPNVVGFGGQTICEGDTITLSALGAVSYNWDNGAGGGASVNVSPASTTVYTVIGTTNGCQASDQVLVTVNPSPNVVGFGSQTICEGDTITLSALGAVSYNWDNGAGGGASVNVSPASTTVYTVIGTTNGCQASDQVLVTVNPSPNVVGFGSQTICQGDTITLSAFGAATYSWNNGAGTGSTVTVSPSVTTVYIVTGTTNACMSSDQIVVEVNQPTDSNLTYEACGSFILNGVIYTQSGQYFQILSNTLGCDSTIKLNLTINSVDTSITVSGNTLIANNINASYQWIDCNSMQPIQGATSQAFSPGNSGSFGLILTQNTCIDTSGCHSIIITSAKEILLPIVDVFPNPTTRIVTVDLHQRVKFLRIKVKNIIGQEIGRFDSRGTDHAVVEIEGNPGVYILEIHADGSRIGNFRIMKR
ncbi:MAG: hypothetical protein H6581_03120 [Bacteroidia bacterium]|nr:hypothetical protein [Bacteroidia bacterium]